MISAKTTRMIGVMIEGYGRAATEAQMEAYLVALSDVDDVDAQCAVLRAIREPRQHPPSPGEIRQEAMSNGDATGRAMEAWAVYERAQRTVGGEYGICFEDGLINATVRSLGGWKACCLVPDKEFQTWHKRAWMAEYQRFAREGAPASLVRAIGSCLPRDFKGETLKRIGCDYQPTIRGTLPQPPQNLLEKYAQEAMA